MTTCAQFVAPLSGLSNRKERRMSEQEPDEILAATDLTEGEVAAIQESQQEPETADPDDPEVS
jgi:hypothetical protein